MLRPQHLTAVRSPSDLPELFEALGYVADDTPFPDGWHAVARWQAYRVIACDASDGRAAVRGAVRRFATATPALLVALAGREMVVAATAVGPSLPRLLVLALDAPSADAVERLEALRPQARSNTLSHALHVVDALSTEIVGERFYTAFRGALERMVASLDGRHPRADRTMAALLALTRVLFLYFVQAKGWLDGRRDYLRALLDDRLAHRRHFHRTALHPLFFGTLNRPVEERTGRRELGTIPYLNGGLFEPHPVERRLGPVVFSNELWRSAFDDLFERFRFCVREADEVNAIAPDMLGRVFERVMATEHRHRTGTYYTPAPVVHDVVRAALATALVAHGEISADYADAVLEGRAIPSGSARRVAQTLTRLRLLDPAVGSGAFLLGALDLLTTARLAVTDPTEPREPHHTRRRVLRENLFGVDLSPVAVRLAELRLWLAIVADDPSDDLARIEPLPNLDGVVRQGDSLLDPIAAARALGLSAPLPRRATTAVAAARDALFEARGAGRRAAQRALRAHEEDLARSAVDAADARIRHALRDLAALARGHDLFGRRSGLGEPQRRLYRTLRTRRMALRTARKALDDGVLPFFAFDVHRPEVVAQGGFTVVVGNPPWVRSERLPDDTRKTLKERFSWWRAGSGRGFAHLPDLSVAFLERAFELAADDGVVGLLVPSKLASAGYAATARAALVRETTLTYLHRVPDRAAAQFGATTYPLAVVARKRPPPADHQVSLDFGVRTRCSQRALAADGPWILTGNRERAALTRYLDMGQPLAAVGHPALGVKTGADGLLVGRVVSTGRRTRTVRFGAETVELERTVLRAVLRGRDVAPFRGTPTHVVLWGYDAAASLRARLPRRAAAYVRRIAEALEARADFEGGPPWTLFRLRAARPRHRVVWRDIARRPAAVALPEDADSIPLNSCYVLIAPDAETAHVVTATLNATWSAVTVRALADEARGGYRRINATVASRLPVPTPSPARDRLAAFGADAHASNAFDQDTLDELVADALRLPRAVRRELAALADDSR
ncbi:MAG TPA: DNA methyltransferase [Gemmatimonadales bacterium]|nr:DNA methyltransferase [Gemmatimonadales bacterium]